MTGYRELLNLIEPSYPRLLERIREGIEKREKAFERKEKGVADSFLWEHSLHVALYARKICLLEKMDPMIPVLAALFHDIGKFDDGLYHKENIPEEEQSSKIASEFLHLEGAHSSDIDLLVSVLKSLYDENKKGNLIADILHDADFLAKSGYLGIANFFTKSALKGQSLMKALSLHLSKELTYASVLLKNMKTLAGKKIAEQKSKDTLSFFRKLIRELSEAGIAEFVILEEEMPCPQKGKKSLKIHLAVPLNCPTCEGKLEKEYSFEQGIKCTELVIGIRCQRCPFNYRMSFCLPELLS
jgi:HD superfamily phosphodiesterase